MHFRDFHLDPYSQRVVPPHDYRRYRVPGGTYFFTINLLERRSDLLIRPIEGRI